MRSEQANTLIVDMMNKIHVTIVSMSLGLNLIWYSELCFS
jgi:hypothetical protein